MGGGTAVGYSSEITKLAELRFHVLLGDEASEVELTLA